jgi:hypothetical protein
MGNDNLLSKQEVMKIIKHEFDRWLESKDPAFSRYKQIHCVLSAEGFLSVVAVIQRGSVLIISFDRDVSGDVISLERVQRAVDNNWWELQRIVRIEYYERLLDEINSSKG